MCVRLLSVVCVCVCVCVCVHVWCGTYMCMIDMYVPYFTLCVELLYVVHMYGIDYVCMRLVCMYHI